MLVGHSGDVTRQAHDRGVARQTRDRETAAVRAAREGASHRAQREQLRQQRATAHARVRAWEERLGPAVVLDAAQQAEFARTAQAEGVRRPLARRLWQVVRGRAAPRGAQLGRWTHTAGRRAGAARAVLDALSRPPARPAAAEEIIVGRRPILLVVEPDSLCWLSGHRADQRDGVAWAGQCRQLPALEPVTRNGGTGMEQGLQQVNAERCAHGRPSVADQADHFHRLREGTRALQRRPGQASRALEAAERAEAALVRVRRQGKNRAGAARVAGRRWREAAAAVERWSAAEQAWQRLRAGRGLFTPDGTLNTRAQGAALVEQVRPELSGPEWANVRRQLTRPEGFTFWGRVGQHRTALPVPAEVRQAAVRNEGLRCQPHLLAGETAAAAARRGVLLLTGVVLARGGEAAPQAVAAVRGVLRQAWRASSLGEGLKSVLRRQQSRHRRLTQELLDWKRLDWNCRPFRTGRRKQQTP